MPKAVLVSARFSEAIREFSNQSHPLTESHVSQEQVYLSILAAQSRLGEACGRGGLGTAPWGIAQQQGPLVRDAPSSHRSGRHILTGVTVHPLGLHRSPSPHSFWDQCFLVPTGPSSQGETNKRGQRDQLQPLSL